MRKLSRCSAQEEEPAHLLSAQEGKSTHLLSAQEAVSAHLLSTQASGKPELAYQLSFGNVYQTTSLGHEDPEGIDHEDNTINPISEVSRVWGLTIIGQDIPWDLLFYMAFTKIYREVVVEFLSTFTYTVSVEDDVDADRDEHELPDDQEQIWFRMFGHVYCLRLRQWAVVTGLYNFPEMVTPLYTEAVTQVDREEILVIWGLLRMAHG
ncbi:hypothetical protein L1987_54113 [Smallanthus sonchifolius]|uniref:Uncharacterized protein n=1 Tax=Smallanthus sonchifolius TaxID=185202 RepID=A0ACB9E7A4_9ASTR|nr:hypothetical protein L1987_54113 [Smallanthus sonchifolius]